MEVWKWYILEPLRTLGSIENDITEDKNDENVPHFEITGLILVLRNIVYNDYKQDSRALYTFVPIKSLGQSFEISRANFIFLKTFNSEYWNTVHWNSFYVLKYSLLTKLVSARSRI